MHRDLKPENVLLLSQTKNQKDSKQMELKLIDFGESTKYNKNKLLKTKVGTPY